MKRRHSDVVSELFDEHQLPIKFIYDMDTLVDCSFLVQNSVLYLDLNVGEFSNFKRETKRPDIYNFLNEPGGKRPRVDFFTDLKVIYTEEDCKKLFAPYRQLLYVYHLDVSKKLDHNLRTSDMRNIRSCCSDNIFLSKVVCDSDIYQIYLNRIITDAIKESNQKVKLISKLCKLLRRFRFLSKNCYLQNEGLEILCSEGAEVAVLRDFLFVTNRKEDEFHFEISTEAFKLYLHHANNAGYDLGPIFSECDIIHSLVNRGFFQKAHSAFEYLDAPRFCLQTFRYISKKCRLTSCIALQLSLESGPITIGRCLLILEIVQVYFDYYREGLGTLQKVWRSIPDSFINLDELAKALSSRERLYDAKLFAEICSFLKDVTGEDVLEGRKHQPRKLKHFCRLSIRRVLSSNRQLSTGLDELKCAPSLKSYLKLEM